MIYYLPKSLFPDAIIISGFFILINIYFWLGLINDYNYFRLKICVVCGEFVNLKSWSIEFVITNLSQIFFCIYQISFICTFKTSFWVHNHHIKKAKKRSWPLSKNMSYSNLKYGIKLFLNIFFFKLNANWLNSGEVTSGNPGLEGPHTHTHTVAEPAL